MTPVIDSQATGELLRKVPLVVRSWWDVDIGLRMISSRRAFPTIAKAWWTDVTIPPEKIVELAEASGFDAELRVAAMARRAKMTARQSVYYIDKDERKGRELDFSITASARDKSADPTVSCVVHICVEVKKTKDPFIFFTSPRGRVEPGEAFALIRWLHNVDNKVLDASDIERKRPSGRPPRLARAYHGAKGSGSQQIQSGVLSAVKAALHFRDECCERWSEDSRDVSFFMPVLVVDGPLCECYIDEETNELQGAVVDELVYAQNYLSDNYGDVSSQVYVVSIDRFAEILESYRNWAESIVQKLIETRDRTPISNLNNEVMEEWLKRH